MAYKLPKAISAEIKRGDRTTLTVNTGQDLTGKTVMFSAKVESNVYPLDATDSTAVIKKTAVVNDPVSGVASIELMHDDTKSVVPGEYYCDVQIVDAGQPVSTNIFKIEIVPDVTQATS